MNIIINNLKTKTEEGIITANFEVMGFDFEYCEQLNEDGMIETKDTLFDISTPLNEEQEATIDLADKCWELEEYDFYKFLNEKIEESLK